MSSCSRAVRGCVMFRRMVGQPSLQAHYRGIKSLSCEYDVLLYFHCIREAKCNRQAAFQHVGEASLRFTILAGQPLRSPLPYTSFAFATASWKTSEVVHTNQKHPFFTREHGFLPVGQIKLGIHILRADDRVGEVTGWKVVPGTKTIYNLEVAQDHTFTVGVGQWAVHNDCRNLAQKARTILNDLRRATPTLRVVAVSNFLDPLAGEIIGVSGTQARLYVEGADVVKDVNNARCAELICIQIARFIVFVTSLQR